MPVLLIKCISSIVLIFWLKLTYADSVTVLGDDSHGSVVKEVSVGLGNFEPHFNKNHESGLFVELISETFKLIPDYSVKYVLGLSNYRLVDLLNSGDIDAAANIFTDHKIEGFKSDFIFRFRDVAVSLKEKGHVINKVPDLKGKNIVTYQGAKLFLGQAFSEAVSDEHIYETPSPESQVNMLLAGRVDVSIGDIYIFLHSVKQISQGEVTPEDLSIAYLFPDIYSHMGFKDKKIRDDFNVALRQIKKNGTFERVYSEYLKSLGYSAD